MIVPGYGYKKKDGDLEVVFVPYLVYVNCEDTLWKVKVLKKQNDLNEFISIEETLISTSTFQREYKVFRVIEFDAKEVKNKNFLTPIHKN